MRRMVTVAAVLVAICAARAAADETCQLQHKFWNGQKLTAEESSESAYDLKGKVAGPAGYVGARTGSQADAERRKYTQEMVATKDGIEIRRTYEVATHANEELGSTRMEEHPTSLQGKTVLVGFRGGRSPQIEAKEGKIALEDHSDVLFAERLYKLLPTEPVKAGAVWAADGEALGAVLYGGGQAQRVRAAGTAKATLRGVESAGGQKVATISYQLDPGTGAADVVSATMRFSVDDGTILAFDLAGPISGHAGKGLGVSAEMTGQRKIHYAAHITAKGEPASDRGSADERGPGRRFGRGRGGEDR